MAGKAKPNIPNLKEEGKIKFFEYNDRDGYFDGTDTLLDGNLNWVKHDYGCCLLLRDDNSIDFEIPQKSNIWAYGIYVSDSGGSTPKPVNLYKKINGEFILFRPNVQTYNDKWYLLFDKLDKGIYRIKNIDDYANFTEWYVEELEKTLFLLQDTEDNLYTIKENTISKLDNNDLNKENFINNGFNDYNLITKDILLTTFDSLDNLNVKIYIDDIEKKNMNIDYDIKPFKPINKFKEINNGEFDIIMKEIE